MTSQKATLIGLVAIVLWSTMVGLIRGVSEGLGPVGGAAMIYSLSGLLLIFTVGLPELLTAVALWFHYFLTPQPAMIFSLPVIAKLFTAALTLGFAYAAWNVGILHGNVTIMAVGSYFTPVMSSALAALLLSSPLSFSFWQGAVMVCVGSLLCWLATRRR
ncbi:hypothetical protein BFK01_19105 [Salmonella enterica]|nr:hypothetical protein [Salmonella enterica]